MKIKMQITVELDAEALHTEGMQPDELQGSLIQHLNDSLNEDWAYGKMVRVSAIHSVLEH